MYANLMYSAEISNVSHFADSITVEQDFVFRKVFQEMYEKKCNFWNKVIHKHIVNDSNVDECFQIFLITLWKIILRRKQRYVTDAFSAYCYGALIHRIKSFNRNQRRAAQRFSELDSALSLDELHEADMDIEFKYQLLEDAISKLSYEEKRILSAYVESDLNLMKTAGELGLNTTPVIGKKLQLIMTKLKYSVGAYATDEEKMKTSHDDLYVKATKYVSLEKGLRYAATCLRMKHTKKLLRTDQWEISRFIFVCEKHKLEIPLADLNLEKSRVIVAHVKKDCGDIGGKICQRIARLFDILYAKNIIDKNHFKIAYQDSFNISAKVRNTTSIEAKVKIVKTWITEGKTRPEMLVLTKNTWHRSENESNRLLSQITGIIEATGTKLKDEARKKSDLYIERLNFLREMVRGKEANFYWLKVFRNIIRKKYPFVTRQQARLDYLSAIRLEGIPLQKLVDSKIRQEQILAWFNEGFSENECKQKSIEKYGLERDIANRDIRIVVKAIAESQGKEYRGIKQIAEEKLQLALQMLRNGSKVIEVVKEIQNNFNCHESNAYGMVYKALDILGEKKLTA